MAGKGKNYVVQGVKVKCSLGAMTNVLNTDVGHGVLYQGKPVLNANDHMPMLNITPFGMCGNKPCAIATPLAWQLCNDDFMIDGAPALTMDSVCTCMLGGVISIVKEGAGSSGADVKTSDSEADKKQNNSAADSSKKEDAKKEDAKKIASQQTKETASQETKKTASQVAKNSTKKTVASKPNKTTASQKNETTSTTKTTNNTNKTNTVTKSSLATTEILSPNKTSPRNHAIDTITIHCMAGDSTVEECGKTFAKKERNASSNYGIDSKGNIALYVDEKDRSWCSSSRSNDHRAVTIEVANNVDTKEGDRLGWPVSEEAFNALIELCTDICWRNGIKELKWRADKKLIGQIDQQNMTVHRWFDEKNKKVCPGDYLYNKHGEIAEKVNAKLAQKEIVKRMTEELMWPINKLVEMQENADRAARGIEQNKDKKK